MIGWRAPERANTTRSHAITIAVTAITTVVAFGKSPKAIPEFCT
jgi:hypothetical protein